MHVHIASTRKQRNTNRREEENKTDENNIKKTVWARLLLNRARASPRSIVRSAVTTGHRIAAVITRFARWRICVYYTVINIIIATRCAQWNRTRALVGNGASRLGTTACRLYRRRVTYAPESTSGGREGRGGRETRSRRVALGRGLARVRVCANLFVPLRVRVMCAGRWNRVNPTQFRGPIGFYVLLLLLTMLFTCIL